MGIDNQFLNLLDANSRTSRLTVEWTSDGSGDVSEAISTDIMKILKGKNLAHFLTNPGAIAPTDNYDLTFIDTYGIDVLGGEGIDRDTVNAEQSLPALKSGVYGDRIIDTVLTFTIANAGDTKQGTAIFYFRW